MVVASRVHLASAEDARPTSGSLLAPRCSWLSPTAGPVEQTELSRANRRWCLLDPGRHLGLAVCGTESSTLRMHATANELLEPALHISQPRSPGPSELGPVHLWPGTPGTDCESTGASSPLWGRAAFLAGRHEPFPFRRREIASGCTRERSTDCLPRGWRIAGDSWAVLIAISCGGQARLVRRLSARPACSLRPAGRDRFT